MNATFAAPGREQNPALPDFIIAGAAKAGTTTLCQYLKQHPGVFIPEHKEPYFFSFDGAVNQADDPDFRKLIIDKPEAYRSLFAPALPGQLLGEASTSYLYTHQISVEKMRRVYRAAGKPLPKIIAILRNPADRAFSHHLYLRQKGVEDLSFESAIQPEIAKQRLHLRYWDYDYVEYGRYIEQVRHYKEAFPHVLIFLFEDLVRRPEALLQEMLSFLGLEAAQIKTNFVTNPSGEPINKTLVQLLIGDTWFKSLTRTLVPTSSWDMMRRWRDTVLKRFLRQTSINAATRAHLAALYRHDNVQLQELLGRDLSAWM